MFMFIDIERFSKAEYREMVLLSGECRRNTRSAGRLYRQCCPAGPHPSHQIILTIVKHKREAGCMTSLARSGRLP